MDSMNKQLKVVGNGNVASAALRVHRKTQAHAISIALWFWALDDRAYLYLDAWERENLLSFAATGYSGIVPPASVAWLASVATRMKERMVLRSFDERGGLLTQLQYGKMALNIESGLSVPLETLFGTLSLQDSVRLSEMAETGADLQSLFAIAENSKCQLYARFSYQSNDLQRQTLESAHPELMHLYRQQMQYMTGR